MVSGDTIDTIGDTIASEKENPDRLEPTQCEHMHSEPRPDPVHVSILPPAYGAVPGTCPPNENPVSVGSHTPVYRDINTKIRFHCSNNLIKRMEREKSYFLPSFDRL